MDLKKDIDAILKYIIAGNMFLYFLNQPQHIAYFKKVFDDGLWLPFVPIGTVIGVVLLGARRSTIGPASND